MYIFLYKQINVAGKQILKSKEVINRLEVNGGNNSFIILKDQKENLQTCGFFEQKWTRIGKKKQIQYIFQENEVK